MLRGIHCGLNAAGALVLVGIFDIDEAGHGEILSLFHLTVFAGDGRILGLILMLFNFIFMIIVIHEIDNLGFA
jgi:hypothetical protein